jgi:hypothetical protein
MAGLLTALVMFGAAGAAWGGLAWLVVNVPPARPLALLAGYIFAFAAVTSSGALLAWLAFRPRTPEGQLRSPADYLPHSMLLAIIVLFGVWLQSLRVLTPLVALLLLGLYALLELAVLFGTRGSVELPISKRSSSSSSSSPQ